MQQIEIEMVGAETSEARRAGTGDAISRHFIGLHLGDQEYTVALTGNGVTDELLGAAISVISRRIDQRQAERSAGVHRFFFNSWRMPSLSQMPGALSERRDGGAVWKPYGTSCGLRCRACGGESACASLYRKRYTYEGQ